MDDRWSRKRVQVLFYYYNYSFNNLIYLSLRVMPKIVNTALKAKAKAIKFDLEAPRGQGLASRTTSLVQRTSSSLHFSEISEVTL